MQELPGVVIASCDIDGVGRLRLTPSYRGSHAGSFLLPLFFLAVVGIERPLAQPDRFRRHLDQFVVFNVGQCLFANNR